MSGFFSGIRDSWRSFNEYERLKLGLLTLTFFLVIGSYTLVKEIKDTVFANIVGWDYQPYAKLIAMFMLIPALFFYSFLVDKMRRYQLLCFYSLVYGILGLVSVYLIGHPVIGLGNTDTSPYRLFGWFFYFFIEAFTPFVVSVFWAFVNSISSPTEAKQSYALIVSGSKFGGMFTAGIAWLLFSFKTHNGLCFSAITTHQILLTVFSFLVLAIPVVIYALIKKVPGRFLHGYEAVYQFEKEKKKEGREGVGIFSGLQMLIKWPYVLGIFGMLFFYEAVATILSYHRGILALTTADGLAGMGTFFFKMAFAQHLLGFIISYIGTRTLLNKFGEKICLLLVPISTAVLLFMFIFFYTPLTLIFAIVLLRAINYAFAQPVRESLYIPTVKDMKFKTKSWIDSFGAKLAKGLGSGVNLIGQLAGSALFFPVHSVIFIIICSLWFINSLLLGNKYEKVIKNNEVIGAEFETN